MVIPIVYAVLSATVLHGSVDGDSLGRSVEREIGAGPRIYDDGYGCQPQGGARTWNCAVPTATAASSGIA